MSKSKSKSRKNTTLKIRQRRNFTETFKREKVEELTSGLYSISSFCKLWDLSLTTAYRWIYQYSPQHKKGTIMVVQKESESAKTSELLTKVAELERRLGQKQMQLDYLEKLVELASKEYEIDFKKNFNVQL
jgi:transposase-like protein